MNFRLAPMCRFILMLTVVLLSLPVALLAGAAAGARVLTGVALLTILIYMWVWTRFRPTAFIVHPHALEVVWPLKRRELERAGIVGVRLMTRQELRQEVGWGVRVGAAGLWGGFGWLWTERRGIVQMYISRID